ncbi:LOG family protein [Paenibacillus sp. BSR1-1]|uniref:LOG family protein n=1 Tax=Paenibacillus sp. BSR1-1 TaxID=3020845 RepID=UPI0025AECF6E|nr:LOG family protein [Paenibacillus sp. BSR1-1]MDN3015509.1 LOG family protein [Paenibacillus sp. BSR1-1]
MMQIELYGTVFYDPATNEWTGSGTGWWIEKTEKNIAKITFEEAITFDPRKPSKTNNYSLSISNINDNGNVDSYNVDEDGFILCWEDYSNDTCIASFQVIGTKVSFVPNDRALGTDESVADIYAAELLFSYEAKYGVISLMGSGSISSKEIAEKKLHILNSHAEKLQTAIEKDQDPFNMILLQGKLERTKIKMERQHRIVEKSAKYWDSALKFGELWGHYSANEQEKALGGCYVPLCTGGGPGIMRAGAQGARSQHAHVIGIDCQFGVDNFFNLKDTYSVHSNQRLRMNNFSIREGVLINYSHVILFWPGGFGTAWEVYETLSKIQTNHLRRHRTKAIFVHPEYWEPFFKCIDHMREYGAINSYGDRIKIPGVDDHLPDEAYLAEVASGPEEAFEKTRAYVEQLYRKNQLTLKA